MGQIPISSGWDCILNRHFIQSPARLRSDFTDQVRPDDRSRDFEIGFYRYGPTWYTRNHIIEFWIGNAESGGTLSIIGNDQGGGRVEVRNPTDTDSISVNYMDAERPTILTDSGIALHFKASEGLISEDRQTFEQGIVIPFASDYAGQVIGGGWQQGSIVVPTHTVEATSLITITPLSQPQGLWWVSHIEAGQFFTVSSASPDENMDFNWVMIGSDAP